jgi:signal peptidase I
MTVDFSAALVAALLLAVILWGIDVWIWQPKRLRGAAGATTREPWAVHHARTLFPVILIVLIVRSFVFEPFRIPSASMMPGLVDGDFIFVSKFAYGLRLPVTNALLLRTGAPQRGDVIVFRLPSDPSTHFIKRLVGLPGEHVQVRDNHVFIDGKPLPLEPAGRYAGGYGFTGAAIATEHIPQRDHTVMLAADRYATDFDAIVPAGHYFFMGDNRNDSEDSRFALVGFVPEQNLVGHATRIWMNWQIPGWPKWRRIGQKIL